MPNQKSALASVGCRITVYGQRASCRLAVRGCAGWLRQISTPIFAAFSVSPTSSDENISLFFVCFVLSSTAPASTLRPSSLSVTMSQWAATTTSQDWAEHESLTGCDAQDLTVTRLSKPDENKKPDESPFQQLAPNMPPQFEKKGSPRRHIRRLESGRIHGVSFDDTIQTRELDHDPSKVNDETQDLQGIGGHLDTTLSHPHQAHLGQDDFPTQLTPTSPRHGMPLPDSLRSCTLGRPLLLTCCQIRYHIIICATLARRSLRTLVCQAHGRTTLTRSDPTI